MGVGGEDSLIGSVWGASLSKGIIHLALPHFLFEFHSPILKPDLNLSFRKAKLGGELCPPLTSEEVVVMEFLLKFKNLFWRVHSSHSHQVSPGSPAPSSPTIGPRLLALSLAGLSQLWEERGCGEAGGLGCLGEAGHTREAAEAEERGRGHEAAWEHASTGLRRHGFLSLYEQSEIIQGKSGFEAKELNCQLLLKWNAEF